MDSPSGVGVIDRSIQILSRLEEGPATLLELVEATGIARPTVHRLAAALIHHRIVGRDESSRYILGKRLNELATAAGTDRITALADPVLNWLRETTGESAQIYRAYGQTRVCVASVERPVGLRDSIPVGSEFSMKAGSAAQVLLAWQDHQALAGGLHEAAFSSATLASVRRRGWAQSVGERELGVASVSAPVRNGQGPVIAAISISGPVERLTRNPGRYHGSTVMTAASRLSKMLEHDG
ncbi:IclR family transcriptional regulator NdgR [Yaniella flava]|uniref:IclR family transcriptional regulator NdgR n=1 Tax=Yaniella flava TaxID=287930 RepID=A0ABN2V2A7_9MICC